jgi:hypothetical protein
MEHCEISNSKHQITIKSQISISYDQNRFGILNFGHCDLPFDLAQGGESFDSAQDREPAERLVEPFGICDLLFGIFGHPIVLALSPLPLAINIQTDSLNCLGATRLW